MAEILLSLTIIGVVAAITLPSLTGNINERTWNTQRKALYARMSQAISLMPALNGYGTVMQATSSASAIDTAAETFITAGLSKVFKINNICGEKLEDCGIVSKYTDLKGTQKPMPKSLSELHSTLVSRPAFNVGVTSFPAFTQNNVKAAAFETANGESILLFYNPTCVSSLGEKGTSLVMQSKMCANLIYDLNGSKGPNTVGKDIGIMTIYYPIDSMVVTVQPATQDAAGGAAVVGAATNGACAAMDSEYRMPNLEELAAIYINSNMFGRNLSGAYWASTRFVNHNNLVQWHISMGTGILGWDPTTDTSKLRKVLCVKR